MSPCCYCTTLCCPGAVFHVKEIQIKCAEMAVKYIMRGKDVYRYTQYRRSGAAQTQVQNDDD